MNFLRYVLAVFGLLGSGTCAAELLTIYTYTAADGGISLSNVPADNRYSMLVHEMLVQEPKKKVAAIPPPGSGKPAVPASKAKYDKLSGEVAHAPAESHYAPEIASSPGAAGPMQLVPQTAKRDDATDAPDAVADGDISLGNVPADNHHSMLVQDMQKKVVATIHMAAPGKPSAPANKAKYDKLAEEVARAHGLEVALLHAMISVESRYDPKIVSRAGAVGMMQLMPATAKRYGVTDSYDAAQNMHGGARYMRHLLKMFNNDVSLALAAYNAGEHAVIRHGNSIPPFPETRNYVPKVLGYYRKYRKEL